MYLIVLFTSNTNLKSYNNRLFYQEVSCWKLFNKKYYTLNNVLYKMDHGLASDALLLEEAHECSYTVITTFSTIVLKTIININNYNYNIIKIRYWNAYIYSLCKILIKRNIKSITDTIMECRYIYLIKYL